MRRARRNNRGGFTLLELIVTAALAGTLASSVFVLLRTCQSVWEAHATEMETLESAHAAVRHVVRCVRQADSVVSYSKPTDANGSLTLLMPSGETYVWQHSGDQLNFGVDKAHALLASGIGTFTIACYQADGQTATTEPLQTQCVECTVTVQLDRSENGSRTIRCRAWRRTW